MTPLLRLPNTEEHPLSIRAKALVFEDPDSRKLLAQVEQVAPSDATVLITGETGTGKEIIARHLHERSARRHQPFVAVNCGAFAESLVESELYGHEKGAFTGALAAKAGWFEAAHGGTLFLDEIGDLPASIQVKLLRLLQEREVVRLGSRQPIAIDVRLIAATNVNLEQAVAAGHFREDLYYRLNVASLSLKPLRERPGDILPLAQHFVDVYAQKLAAPAVLAPSAAERLLEHPWPGNIRELENAIHHALLVCRDRQIVADDLRLTTLRPRATHAVATQPGVSPLERAFVELFERDLPDLHERIEELLYRTAYRYCDRNQIQTSKLLGVSRNVVRARLAQFGDLPAPRASLGRDKMPQAAETVRVGYQKFGVLSLLKATGALERVFAAEDARVAWIEFPGGIQLVEALQSDELDLGLVGEGPPVFAQASRAPIVYLAAEPPAPEGEAIIVHRESSIRSIAELKGKTIALNKGANVDYLLIRALEEEGLGYDDVKVAFVPPTGARAAFESREVDAWAIWNPHLASIEHATGARVLRDGRGLASNTAYYIGRRAFADARPALVQAFLAEVKAVGEWANHNLDAAAELLAGRLGMAKAALAHSLAQSPFGVRPVDAQHVASQQAVADKFHALKLIPRAISVADAQWRAPAANFVSASE